MKERRKADAIAWYDAHSAEVARLYERINPNDVNGWLLRYLPTGTAAVLDVGAGTGRDAAWMARRGLRATAVEPSKGMMSEGSGRHPETVQWLNDALPELHSLRDRQFELVLLSAVWPHIHPSERQQAIANLIRVTSPGGIIAITFHSKVFPERDMHPSSANEISRLARSHDATVVFRGEDHEDLMGRTGIAWTLLAVRKAIMDTERGSLPTP